MLEAGQEALTFAEGRTRADLESNRMLAHALVGCLRIVGEAARQVSSETRQQYPAIPWRDIIGMRNQTCTRVLQTLTMTLFGKPSP